MSSHDDDIEDDGYEEEEASPFIDKTSFGRRMGDTHGASGTWLISFTDVMALMLTFFVMLFAMSHPPEETWEDFSTSIQSELNKFYGRPLARATEDAMNLDKLDLNRALDLSYLKVILLSLIKDETALEQVSIITQPRSLVVSFPDDLLFDPGRTDIKPGGSDALFALGGALSRIRNRIEVAGHADPRPPSATSSFPSNWELSLARAASVAAALENVGYSKTILVRGHASGRYEDLPRTIEEDQRLGLARRVDIVIMEDDGRVTNVLDAGRP